MTAASLLMVSSQRILLVIVCLGVYAFGTDKHEQKRDPNLAPGAWLQTDLDWEQATKDVNARLRTAVAAVLYFGEDHTFALLYCSVNQVAGEYTAISRGDGLALIADNGLQTKEESQSHSSSCPSDPSNGRRVRL